MISERFAKQRDLSIWLTIILPLYTVAYLMQWYNYLDYLQVRPSPTTREVVFTEALPTGIFPSPGLPLPPPSHLTSCVHTHHRSSWRCTKFSPC